MGSEFFYRKYAEVFLSRPASDTTELNAMKVKLQCTTASCRSIAQGYNDAAFSQLCLPTGVNLNILDPNNALIDHFTCNALPLTGTAGTNLSALRKQETQPCPN